MPAHPNLSLARQYLAGLPGLTLEWSVQLKEGRSQLRDRLIFWVGKTGGADNAPAFAALAALLAETGAPDAMRRLQADLAPACLRQGLGLCGAAGGGAEICLYLHHTDPASGREHYDAYKWSPGGAVEPSCYEFHFLPCSATGQIPAAMIHPTLAAAYARLARDPRLAAMSGFWLRRSGDAIDQISLTYPWLPAAGELPGLTGLLPPRLEQERLRHIAFSGTGAAAPALTLYFSGELHGPWPDSADGLRALAGRWAHRASANIAARGLDQLPAWLGTPAWPEPPPALSRAADAARAARLLPRLEQRLAPGASVYLIGCGWGELASGLWRSRRCRSIGITNEPAQFFSCMRQGQRTRLGAPHRTVPPGHFDCITVLDAGAAPAWIRSLRPYAGQVLFCTGNGELDSLAATRAGNHGPHTAP